MLRKYKITALLIAVSLLSGCSEGKDISQSSDSSAAHESIIQDNDSSSVGSSVQGFAADILGYRDGVLTYSYNGETVTEKVSREVFDTSGSLHNYLLCEKIINNCYGIAVKGYIKLNRDGKVMSCNVRSLNGSDFDSSSTVDEIMRQKGIEQNDFKDVLHEMNRISGSVYEFKNEYFTFTGDLNDMRLELKGDYGNNKSNVMVTGYRFKTGEIVIESVAVYDHDETDDAGHIIHVFSSEPTQDKYHFFGKIQSLSDGRATVLLNDGKTVCDVPTYYNDGELTEGQQVMVTLNAEPSLYGSGEQYKADYAVFTTDCEFYGIDVSDFDSLAYAHLVENDLTRFECVTVDDIT